MNFKIIDTGIMDGFETLTRLGGYIMLFSMIASLLQKLPVPHIVTLILTGMVEITNGIAIASGFGSAAVRSVCAGRGLYRLRRTVRYRPDKFHDP